MVLQRGKPIFLWGESERTEQVEVKLNDRKICTAEIPAGKFELMLPAQEAAEDVVLEIGDTIFSHVDIGEVWIAGGQSNMEFMLQYTSDGEQEIAAADDPHLRMYTVGQYSFAGEREEGYKAWNPWDQWLPYKTEHAAEFSAVAVYFAKELRKNGVPVGILSCNWGGTSASAWLDRKYLEEDAALRCYFVQLAPYGTWMHNSNENYPLLRKKQEEVSKSVKDVWMTSSSDLGNVYDIHPKEKAPLGRRLALESHIYAYGSHGFSTADSSVTTPGTEICSRASRWVEDSVEWLKDMWGDFGQGKMTEPKCKRRMNADREPYLSVDCTMGLLMADPEAKAVVGSMMAEIQKGMVERYGKEKVENQGGSVDSALFLKNMTLRDILNAGKMPEAVAEELEKKLNRIENRCRL